MIVKDMEDGGGVGMRKQPPASLDVDEMFSVVGGWGRYQLRQYLLLSFPILFSSYQTVAYIFTTGNPVYRCRVPECEGEANNNFHLDQFMTPWLHEAMPVNDKNNMPEQCLRYRPVYTYDVSTTSRPNPIDGINTPSLNYSSKNNEFCGTYKFDKNELIECDSWIFNGDENTIVKEFDILCADNAWKIALVGSVNYLGFFVGMPASGIIADRYGRRKVLSISCFVQSLIGIIRSFSPNFECFLVLQFLGAFMSGAYNAGFVLGLEIVGPKKRVLGNAIICCFHSLGEGIVGLAMWALKDWRSLTKYLFMPGLLSIFYLRIIPESIRWLVAKGRIEETMAVFDEMCLLNKGHSLPTTCTKSTASTCEVNDETNNNDTVEQKQKLNHEETNINCVSEEIMMNSQTESKKSIQDFTAVKEVSLPLATTTNGLAKTISTPVKMNLVNSAAVVETENNSNGVSRQPAPPLSTTSTLAQVVKSSRLKIRLANCTLCWMVITMVFFGLSIGSITVAGNKYLNFIMSVLVELPAYLSTWLLMDVVKIGRRSSLAASFFMAGVTCITYTFISDVPVIGLLVFLLGKFSITFGFAVIYIFTAEMFPTEARNSLLGVCSMAGHVGSILAPQTTLLEPYMAPMLLWGLFSLVAAALCTLFPETLNSKLPDTIEEAENIGCT